MDEFEQIYTRYFESVYRFILSMSRDLHTAEEATQRAFWKSCRHWQDFDGRSDPGTWLCRIAKNEYLAMLRSSKAESHLPAPFDFPAPERTDNSLEDDETARSILRHVHSLDDPYKEVFMLHVYGELPFRSISALFGKSESWARVTYFRAKASVINAMKEEEHGKGM